MDNKDKTQYTFRTDRNTEAFFSERYLVCPKCGEQLRQLDIENFSCNPCPCGHLGDHRHRCSCRSLQIQQYRAKISGPLLDRIDLHVNVEALSDDELVSTTSLSRHVRRNPALSSEHGASRHATSRRAATDATAASAATP